MFVLIQKLCDDRSIRPGPGGAETFVLTSKPRDGRFWPALVGTAWIFCSSYVQWWFSSLPMLPEMLASRLVPEV